MNRLKRIFILAIVLLFLIAAVGLQAAKAATQIDYLESFDYSPETRWTCEHYFPDSACDFRTNYGHGTGDYTSGWIQMSYYSGGTNTWVGLGKTYTLRVPSGYTRVTTCQAKLWVTKYSKDYTTFSAIAGKFRVEIINSASWTYILNQGFTIQPPVGYWVQVATNWFNAPAGNIYLRFVVDGTVPYYVQEFQIDDVEVICNLV
jgi:hypothetical protein